MAKSAVEKTIKLSKKDAAKRLVYGVVYEPDTVDAQNDHATNEEIEKAAHRFMEMYQKVSHEHGDPNPKLKVVESYIAPCEMTIGEERVKKGTWVMVVKVNDDELWKSVEDGEITGLSMGGLAERIYMAGEKPPEN